MGTTSRATISIRADVRDRAEGMPWALPLLVLISCSVFPDYNGLLLADGKVLHVHMKLLRCEGVADVEQADDIIPPPIWNII